jgi:hypothetical protein
MTTTKSSPSIEPEKCIMCDRTTRVKVMPFPFQSLVWFIVGYLSSYAVVHLW